MKPKNWPWGKRRKEKREWGNMSLLGLAELFPNWMFSAGLQQLCKWWGYSATYSSLPDIPPAGRALRSTCAVSSFPQLLIQVQRMVWEEEWWCNLLHAVSGHRPSISWFLLAGVLVSAGIESIFFLVAGIVLCFGFSMRIMLITHCCFSCF